ncbi:YeiH family protein [Sporosarcina sp. FSL K6-6792]|uniref:YeiH family protein n=1 Tax=Sporosarcina sp. FSL K6-6792 TaxID=2921559 RepID=UPI0030FB2618
MEEGMAMKKGFWLGIGLTFFIAVIAKLATLLPYISLIGPLVFAILIGMLWNTFYPVRAEWEGGIEFASKKLLRAGIILLGMRLNLGDIASAGWPAFLWAVGSVLIGIGAVYGIARAIGADKTISFLTACGTGICGAAAIVAVASQVKAKPEQTAISVAIIAILGTLFTFVYTLVYPVLELSSRAFGMFAGGTLHEIAHVVAAGDVGGTEALDFALVVKLTRVMLLVFVAGGVGIWMSRKNKQSAEKFNLKTLPIPWFIFGFLAVSALYTTGIVPEAVASVFVTLAYLLMAMSMAGLGLNVKFEAFRSAGMKPFVAGLGGTVILVLVGYMYARFVL